MATTWNDPPRGRARWVFPFLGLVAFLTAIGNFGLVSVMPMIGRVLDIPDYLVASVFSLSALTWAISSPYWVKRIGRAGPNYYIRAGLVGFVASMAGCALAVELGLAGVLVPFATFLAFFLLRSIYGLLGAAGATATQALVALGTDEEQRTRTLTGLAGALSLGTIIGPAAAPLMIIEPLGVLGPMAGFAVLGLVALAGTYIALPETGAQTNPGSSASTAEPAPSLVDIWRRPDIEPFLTFGLLLCSAQAINIYTIGFVVIDRLGEGPLAGQHMIGLVMTAGATAALFAQWGVARMVTLSPRAMMFGGGTVAMAGNAWAMVDPGLVAAFGAFVLASFGYGLARPGFSAGASLAGNSRDQIAIASAVTLIAGASITLPPVLASAAYQYWLPAPFLLAALAIAGLLLRAAFAAIVHRER